MKTPRPQVKLSQARVRCESQRMLVSGVLDFDTLLGVKTEGEALLAQHADIELIDLSEVEQVSSAALSLLLSWLRTAKELQREIMFANLPQDLLGIARVSGLDQLLPVVKK